MEVYLGGAEGKLRMSMIKIHSQRFNKIMFNLFQGLGI